MALIYKIVSVGPWRDAEAAPLFSGAPVDVADGLTHFSTAQQLRATAAKHFCGRDDLLLVAVDPDALGDQLRWEPSRGGALFPHLYAALPLAAVRSTAPLRLGSDGTHRFPSLPG